MAEHRKEITDKMIAIDDSPITFEHLVNYVQRITDQISSGAILEEYRKKRKRTPSECLSDKLMLGDDNTSEQQIKRQRFDENGPTNIEKQIINEPLPEEQTSYTISEERPDSPIIHANESLSEEQTSYTISEERPDSPIIHACLAIKNDIVKTLESMIFRFCEDPEILLRKIEKMEKERAPRRREKYSKMYQIQSSLQEELIFPEKSNNKNEMGKLIEEISYSSDSNVLEWKEQNFAIDPKQIVQKNTEEESLNSHESSMHEAFLKKTNLNAPELKREINTIVKSPSPEKKSNLHLPIEEEKLPVGVFRKLDLCAISSFDFDATKIPSFDLEESLRHREHVYNSRILEQFSRDNPDFMRHTEDDSNYGKELIKCLDSVATEENGYIGYIYRKDDNNTDSNPLIEVTVGKYPVDSRPQDINASGKPETSVTT